MKKSLIPALIAASALSGAYIAPSFADTLDTADTLTNRILELETQNKNLANELKDIKKLISELTASSPKKSHDNPGGTTATYKALALKPSFDFAQTYASKETGNSGSGKGSELYELEFDHSYAYEVGLDYQATNSPWGGQITFRELQVDKDGKCRYDAVNDEECGSSIAHGDEDFGEADEAGMYYEGINDFYYNDLEILASYDPVDPGAINWKFFAGLRSVNIDRSLTSNLYDDGDGDDTGSTETSSKFSGIGPTFAVKASKEIFTNNLNIYSKARVALLRGATTSRFDEIPGAFSAGTACEPEGYEDCLHTRVTQHSWNPSYGISIGLDYKWDISEKVTINFDAAYDFDKFINAIADTQHPDDINKYSSRTTYSHLTLSGFSLGLKATYKF